MLNGFDQNGNFKGAKFSENGELLVKVSNGEAGGSETTINNTSSNPVPVNGTVITNKTETTLYAGIFTLNTTEQTIGLNNRVTEISIANYSETANVIVSVDESNYTIAPNLALDLPINKTVSLIGLSATETNTKVQYVIKGEE